MGKLLRLRYVRTNLRAYYKGTAQPVEAVYKVLVAFPCAGCEHIMQPGALVTRHQRKLSDPPLARFGYRYRPQPYCRRWTAPLRPLHCQSQHLQKSAVYYS